MIAEKYIHNIAVGYFISALLGDGKHAHALSCILMNEGPEFTHNFDASLYFLIHRFRNFIIEQNSGLDNVIDELCICSIQVYITNCFLIIDYFTKYNSIDYNNLKGLTVVTSLPANQGGKTIFSIDSLLFLFFGKTTKTDTAAEIFNSYTNI